MPALRHLLCILTIGWLTTAGIASPAAGEPPDGPLSPAEGVEAVEEALKAAKTPSSSPGGKSSGERLTVTGRVLRPDGEPLHSAYANILTFVRRGVTNGTLRTDDAGKFHHAAPLGATVYLMTRREAGLPASVFGPFRSTGQRLDRDQQLDVGELTIEEGFVGSLRFRDPDGQPIAGVQLASAILWSSPEANRGGTGISLPANPASDQAGLLQYEDVSDQPLKLEVWKPGFQFSVRDITFVEKKAIDWTLQPARATVGRVIDAATKTPIAGAEIWLASRRGYHQRFNDPRFYRAHHADRSSSASPNRQLASSDEAGSFTIHHWRDDSSYAVMLFADGYRPLLLNDLSSGQDLGEIKMQPPLSLSGKLVGDLPSLERRANDRRILRYRNELDFGTHNYSGLFEIPIAKDGSFRIDGLVPGDVELLLPSGAVRVRVTEPIEDWTLDLAKPKAPPAEDCQKILVHLKASADQPIKGTVQLHWVLEHEQNAASHGKSYENFAVGDEPLEWSVPLGATVWINDVGLVGSILQERKLGTVEESESAAEFTAVLDPAGAVTGRLLSAHEKPVAGFRMQVDQNPAGSRPRLAIASETFEGSRGRFAIDGLPLEAANQYRIFATIEGSHRIAFSEPFTVSSAMPVAKMDMRMSEPMAITGRLVDAEGQPLPEASMTVTYRTARTVRSIGGPLRSDSQGRFATELSRHLPEGYYELEVRPDKLHAGRTIDLHPDVLQGDQDLGEIRLPRAVTIAGTIVGIDGAPKQDTKLMVMPADRATASFRGYRNAASDHEGRFRIEGVEAVPQRLVVFGEKILEVYGAFELSEDELGNEYWTVLPHPSNPQTTIIVGERE